jgi:hypothetical protein
MATTRRTGGEATMPDEVTATTGALPDDGRRYVLTGPRGVDPVLDAVSPTADVHTVAVSGSADLARRVVEADQLGVCVSWRQLPAADTETPDPVQARIDDAADGW